MSEDTEPDPCYDIICLCCGGRNGEDHPECSVHNYPMTRTGEDLEELPEWHREQPYDHASWFESEDYLGSVVVPIGFELTEDHREFLVLLTRDYQPDNRPMLFKLPYETDNTLPGISVDPLLN